MQMIGAFLSMKRLRRTNEDEPWAYTDEAFDEPVKEMDYSFIVKPNGLSTVEFTVEGYDSHSVTVYMDGTFDECFDALKRMRQAMEQDGLTIETDNWE